MLFATEIKAKMEAKREAKRESEHESKVFFNRLFHQYDSRPAESAACSYRGCSGWSLWVCREYDRVTDSNAYCHWYEMCHHRQRRLFESSQDKMTAHDIKKAKRLLYHRDRSHSNNISIIFFENHRNPPPSYMENAGDKHISARERKVLMREVESLRAQISSLGNTLTRFC